MNKEPMTIQGAEKLREELNELKHTARPKVINAISEARAHGDLKENAEYHAAKEQQSFIEGRLADIEGKLSNAQIIDVTTLNAAGKIVFGTTVELLNDETEEKITYQIVGVDEADIKEHKVSVSSPIARALIGKEEGDEVEVNTPGGAVFYEILVVKYV
ncbi:MAG: transcription elongation factor GreA [Gammaproteobacteria bacterium]|nr:transcription elongation factor GreA [Gammaproteobacteria bacterium]